MISTVIFDLDGLLSDTERIHRRAYQEVLRQHKVEVDAATYADHWIRRGRGIAEFLKDRHLAIDPDIIRREKSVRYRELVALMAEPMPGAREALNRLHNRKTMALGSSSYPDAVDAVLRKLGIADWFQVIVTRGDVERVKPFPDIFLTVAQRLNVSPAECVVVEDAEKGIRAALAAGMKAIAVPNEYTRDNDFSSATLVLPSLHALTVEQIDRL